MRNCENSDSSEATPGWEAKEAIRKWGECWGEIPSAQSVRASRPRIEWFIDPVAALEKDNPHGVAHVGRTIIVGKFIFPYVQYVCGLGNLRKDIIFASLRRHDVRASSRKNHKNHAQAAVDFFTPIEMHMDIVDIWKEVSYVIAHHADKSITYPYRGIHRICWNEREFMQDIDASDLTRPGADKSIGDIRLRTDAAKRIQLPYITQLLRMKADQIHTGDVFEDQVLAGIESGMLRP